MSLAVVFDEYSSPQKGDNIEIEVKRSFSINISAQEAQRQVNQWLFMEVSMMIGAQQPNLAITRDAVVWRVPAIFTAPQVGVVGEVGRIDVNVQTGAMNNSAEVKFEIERNAESLSANLPPINPVSVEMISQEYVVDDLSEIPILEWPNDGKDGDENVDISDDTEVLHLNLDNQTMPVTTSVG